MVHGNLSIKIFLNTVFCSTLCKISKSVLVLCLSYLLIIGFN
jgi:hypothetical protein